MRLSSPRRALVHIALRLYPKAWRARYGDEILEIVERTGISWWHLAGLAWTGVCERSLGSAHDTVDMSLRTTCRRGLRAAVAGGLVMFGAVAIVFFVELIVIALVGGWSGLSVLDFLLRQIGSLRGVTDFVLGTFAAFGHSLLFATPAVVVGLCLGGRWLVAARLVTTVGFTIFTGWLFPGPAVVAAALAGWVFATILFPRRRARTEDRNSPHANARRSTATRAYDHHRPMLRKFLESAQGAAR